MCSPTENRYFYDLVSGLLRAADVAPEYVQHGTQIHTILGLVSAGMGIALAPERARNLLVRGVALRNLSPVPPATAELQFVWRCGHDNPALRRFQSLVMPKMLQA